MNNNDDATKTTVDGMKATVTAALRVVNGIDAPPPVRDVFLKTISKIRKLVTEMLKSVNRPLNTANQL